MKGFTIIAHRGGDGPYKENGLEAFQYGIKHGADFVEMDMRFDHWRQRFYLEHSIWHLRKGRHNIIEKIIPFLPSDTHFVIDLKTLALLRKKVAVHILDLVKAYNLQDRAIFVSFYPFILRILRKLDKNIQLGFLCSSPYRFWFFKYFICWWIKPQTIFYNHKIINANLIKFARDRKLKIISYTLNSKEGWLKAKELGLDGIVTDFPREARKELGLD